MLVSKTRRRMWELHYPSHHNLPLQLRKISKYRFYRFYTLNLALLTYPRPPTPKNKPICPVWGTRNTNANNRKEETQ